MSKSTAIVFILIFSFIFRLEKPVSEISCMIVRGLDDIYDLIC